VTRVTSFMNFLLRVALSAWPEVISSGPGAASLDENQVAAGIIVPAVMAMVLLPILGAIPDVAPV
jgi:hypothetical protein